MRQFSSEHSILIATDSQLDFVHFPLGNEAFNGAQMPLSSLLEHT